MKRKEIPKTWKSLDARLVGNRIALGGINSLMLAPIILRYAFNNEIESPEKALGYSIGGLALGICGTISLILTGTGRSTRKIYERTRKHIEKRG